MKRTRQTDRRLWWLLAAAGLFLALWTAALLGLLGSVLEEPLRQQVRSWLEERLLLLVLVWGFGVLALGFALNHWFDYWVRPLRRLIEQAGVLLRTEAAPTLSVQGNPEIRDLVELFNRFRHQQTLLQQDMDSRVRIASRDIEQERNRLAALMSELTQSVVVCNLDGRVLLYNNRARMQFRALSLNPQAAHGGELIGLGRSIYTVFDRKLVAHAIQSIQHRIHHGAEHPSAQFVTTTQGGQLLRVHMAPVRQVLLDARTNADADATETSSSLAGYVLVLENITREFEQDAARDQLLHGLTEGNRGALASIQAAAELLRDSDVEPSMRERFLGIILEEVATIGGRIESAIKEPVLELRTHWPMEEVLGLDLLSGVSARVKDATGKPVGLAEVDASVWLKVESFSLMQALEYLSWRLVQEGSDRSLQLRLQVAEAVSERAHLDLIFNGAASSETVMGWELEPMMIEGEEQALSVRDVVERHGGALWFERESTREQAFFRFLLPMAHPQSRQDTAVYVRSESRPEYYDFDLFKVSERTRSLDEVPLTDLAYTVFDTETTGLDPSAGDEIIQIGATRVVNSKLLRHECFEQLVDPRRSIPAASIPIHGITPTMVAGQPGVEVVLPAFHAYASDTVLVAHNAAFDMRFLQLKERKTGVVFDQPVLDTLLLSAVVHPNQESHRLEAIAERFNITVIGRHTALGDAMVTAEVFMKLIPLLAEKGIHTLGQAREASQRTYYARITY